MRLVVEDQGEQGVKVDLVDEVVADAAVVLLPVLDGHVVHLRKVRIKTLH